MLVEVVMEVQVQVPAWGSVLAPVWGAESGTKSTPPG